VNSICTAAGILVRKHSVEGTDYAGASVKSKPRLIVGPATVRNDGRSMQLTAVRSCLIAFRIVTEKIMSIVRVLAAEAFCVTAQ
jgi:hypothetical protein